jgi:single-stranded-DNA-specific exonuclease
LREFNFDKVYIVDYIIPFDEVTDDLIEEIYNMNGLWGQGLKETLIAIENIEVKTEDIMLKGDKKETVSFEKDGLEFIKFKCKSNEYETMIGSDDGWGTDVEKVVLNIVGKCSVNDYNNERKLQIVIEDFEVI